VSVVDGAGGAWLGDRMAAATARTTAPTAITAPALVIGTTHLAIAHLLR
jgi:hypothetical protein